MLGRILWSLRQAIESLVFLFVRFIGKFNVLELNLGGEIPDEKPSVGLLLRYFMRVPVSFRQIVFALKQAENDQSIKAMLIWIRGNSLGFAKIQELHKAIKRFREKGKKAFAYLEEAGTLDYYLASSCDKIFMSPSSSLDLTGLLSEVYYFKSLLDKLEIKPEVIQAGKYKSYAEPYLRDDMSEEQKKSLNSILDSLFKQLVDGIKEARGMKEKDIRKIIDRAPLLCEEALKSGLVDKSIYPDQVESLIEKDIEEPLRKIGIERYYNLFSKRLSFINPFRRLPHLALVYASGVIHSVNGEEFSELEDSISAQLLCKVLSELREDPKVKAVVLRIDSPGGSASASDFIWREVELTRQVKPLISSMAEVGASGGYYIGMSASKIFACPSTITGSIGVIAGKVNLKGMYKKLGVSKEILTRGKNADLYSDYSFFSSSARKKLEEEISFLYQDFVRKAAKARGKSYDELNRVSQGRLWTGEQAKEVGLIDEIGGIRDAIEFALKSAGIDDEQKVIVDVYPRPKHLFPFNIPFYLPSLPFLKDEVRFLKSVLLLSRSKFLAIAPFWFKFKN